MIANWPENFVSQHLKNGTKSIVKLDKQILINEKWLPTAMKLCFTTCKEMVHKKPLSKLTKINKYFSTWQKHLKKLDPHIAVAYTHGKVVQKINFWVLCL